MTTSTKCRPSDLHSKRLFFIRIFGNNTGNMWRRPTIVGNYQYIQSTCKPTISHLLTIFSLLAVHLSSQHGWVPRRAHLTTLGMLPQNPNVIEACRGVKSHNQHCYGAYIIPILLSLMVKICTCYPSPLSVF
jgi:hypothetical protein